MRMKFTKTGLCMKDASFELLTLNSFVSRISVYFLKKWTYPLRIFYGQDYRTPSERFSDDQMKTSSGACYSCYEHRLKKISRGTWASIGNTSSGLTMESKVVLERYEPNRIP